MRNKLDYHKNRSVVGVEIIVIEIFLDKRSYPKSPYMVGQLREMSPEVYIERLESAGFTISVEITQHLGAIHYEKNNVYQDLHTVTIVAIGKDHKTIDIPERDANTLARNRFPKEI